TFIDGSLTIRKRPGKDCSCYAPTTIGLSSGWDRSKQLRSTNATCVTMNTRDTGRRTKRAKLEKVNNQTKDNHMKNDLDVFVQRLLLIREFSGTIPGRGMCTNRAQTSVLNKLSYDE